MAFYSDDLPPQGHDFVYLMRCPATNAAAYVGRTGKAIRWRMANHLAPAQLLRQRHRPLAAWLIGLAQRGQRPVVEVVAVACWRESCAVERRTIQHYAALGPLFNVLGRLAKPAG